MKRLCKIVIIVLMASILIGACTQIKIVREKDVITLYHEIYAQVEIISPQGVRVLIDVHDPVFLSKPATKQDILLTTHRHPDHTSELTDAFPGQTLNVKTGEIEKDDVHIRGIASSHGDVLSFKDADGSNYIFLIKIDDICIAHFGDIGQEKLTEEQLKLLGKVDIAITQFANPYADMDIENKKGFNLMAQLKPKMIIPTHKHTDIPTAKYGAEIWDAYFIDNPVYITENIFGGKTKFLFVGKKTRPLAESCNAKKWNK